MSIEKVLQSLGLERKEFKQHLSLITQDSRRVAQGALFFALRGAKEVKIKNAQEALDKGARLVVHDCGGFEKGLFVKNVHAVFSDALKLYYNFENLKVYGVTGTNGKTTYSYMLKSLLESYEVPTGIFGTVENAFGKHKFETGLTSPVSEDFYSFSFENYHKNGMRALVCEVSSHALDQKRMGLNFLDGAAFTSFSQDHLDYHKTMDSYLEAKIKIFTEASKPNAYFCVSKEVKGLLKGVSVDVLNSSDFKISSSPKEFGQSVEFKRFSTGQVLKGFLPMLGQYNVENFGLALMTLCTHFGEDFFPDERVFKSFCPPPGRMEPVILNKKPIAYVDYSHTPDSLQKALETLKPLGQKVFVVFGCGGNRDQNKRAKMGAVASELSDFCFVTSDNPRDEDPDQIINDITKGFKGDDFIAVENRKDAIKKALDKAIGDQALVLIAGKGHEETQELKGKKIFFSDIEEVKKWVKKHED